MQTTKVASVSSGAPDTKITITVDLEPALGATIDYLADRWETKNPAPRDVLLAAITDTLEHLVEDMLIDDWSWYLENDRTVAKIENDVRARLQRCPPAEVWDTVEERRL